MEKEMIEIRISRQGAERVQLGHPWVYRSDIMNSGGAAPGQVVRVLDGRNNRLGAAHYSSSSQIALRMLPREVPVTDTAFFRRLITRAQKFRDQVVHDTEAYRLVHAEADLLPALIVDRYGEYFVIQTLNQGMEASKHNIVAALTELYSPLGIVERNEVAVRVKENLAQESGVLAGDVPAEIELAINGLRMGVDLLHGQKTGLFLDQRENYRAARQYGHGTVLDCFTYNGAFALHLAQAYERVEAVDSSGPSIEQARRNARRNGLDNIQFMEADVFDFLQQAAARERHFDMVVLDPPAFAKSRKHLPAAARGYKEINLKALRLLKRDGILITCSCSHHFTEAELLEVVAAASIDAAVTLRVLERRTQAKDHPILLTVPETHYLKCLVLQVV